VQAVCAVYAVYGQLTVNETTLHQGELAVLGCDADIVLTAAQDTTFMLLGGEPVGPRYVWWNFVATDKEMIERAKLAWESDDTQVFPHIDGEYERIPLP